jgi:hypothetical protein
MHITLFGLSIWKESQVRRYLPITKMIVANSVAHPDDFELGMGRIRKT